MFGRSANRAALNSRVKTIDYAHFASENETTPITSPSDFNIIKMKQLLNTNHTLTFSTQWLTWQYGTLGEQYTEERTGEKVCYAVNKTSRDRVGHALTIVGYDDKIAYDLNGDGDTDEQYEKGAFLIVNSHGTQYGNQGFMWVMYDALNQVSNAPRLNVTNRVPLIEGFLYYFIEVTNEPPALTAEINITKMNQRGEVVIKAKSSQLSGDGMSESYMFKGLSARGYDSRAFNGSIDNNSSYTFFFAIPSVLSPSAYSRSFYLTIIDTKNKDNTIINYVKLWNSQNELIGSDTAVKSINGGEEVYRFDKRTYATSITLNKSTTTIIKGNTERLIATVSPSYATNLDVNWISSNPNVATAYGGFVTCKNVGTTTIRAVTTDGTNLSASCVVQVLPCVERIELNKTQSELMAGQTEQLAGISYPEGTNSSFSWTSSNTAVVEINNDGVVTYKGVGVATIRATATDGSGVYAECIYTNTDDYYNTIDNAFLFSEDSAVYGAISTTDDVDFFKFVPTVSGTYVIYTTGTTDTKGYLYNASATALINRSLISIEDSNFGIKYNLVAGQTYYIKVTSENSDTGNYVLRAGLAIYHASLDSPNQDARNVMMSVEVSSLYSSVIVKIGENTYILSANNTDPDFTIAVTSSRNGASNIWSIVAHLPASSAGVATTVSFSVKNGAILKTDSSSFVLTPYATSMLTGITPDDISLSSLLSSLNSTGHYLTVYNWDNSLVNTTTSSVAGTGLKIVKRNSESNLIEEVMFVVIFGDVNGDGYVELSDANKMFQYVAGKADIEEIYLLAADINHDGEVDLSDSTGTFQYVAGKAQINQLYQITTVPDYCTFI